jgi:ATP synthase protein I
LTVLGLCRYNLAVLQRGLRQVWRKFRPIIGSQALATVIIASVAGWIAGVHGAISAALGGLISIIAGLVFVLLTARSKVRSAGEVLLVAFKAEAAKLFLAISLLWLVLALYRDVVVVGLIGSFVVTILIFSMALFASDKT